MKKKHIWRWAVYYIYLLKRLDGFPNFTKSLGKILQVANCLVILSGSELTPTDPEQALLK